MNTIKEFLRIIMCRKTNKQLKKELIHRLYLSEEYTFEEAKKVAEKEYGK